jgi:hypothetical protein
MEDRPTIREIRNRIRSVNCRLYKTHADPRNADRALWASLAVASFASVTGMSADVQIDPETVLGDLLAGLMHWCDVQQTNARRTESLDFWSALERARNHYDEETIYEQEESQAEHE